MSRDRAARALPAVLIALALAGKAAAQDVDAMQGRWTPLEHDYCGQADDSEVSPLRIFRDGDGTAVGDYGWMCVIKHWLPEAPFLVGDGDCGLEGGGDDFRSRLRIGLSGEDHLVMVRDGLIVVFRRCPATP